MLSRQPQVGYHNVQYAADGSMHYKGRKGFQVKLLGQRLELGEVEAQLRCVPRCL